MKSETEIRDRFNALIIERDVLEGKAREIVIRWIQALAWVLEHPNQSKLMLSDGTKKFLECLY